MVDWHSPETLAANALSFDRFLHAILGLYIWEWVTSLEFDWMFVTGKKKFRWPYVFYFWGRYAMLIGLSGFIIALDIREPINCQALYQVLQVLGNTALGVASVNLAIRTMAVWANRYISIGLILIILGQFGIIIRSMFNVKAAYVDGAGCVTTSIESNIFAAMYIYTMGVDFVVLVLTAYKTFINRKIARSGLVTLLFKDGLAYFAIAFLMNLIAVIFSLLNLNPVMALIADIPATTFATIAACRVVRRLNTYVTGAPQIFSGTLPPTMPSFNHTTTPFSNPTAVDVRVEMSTFNHQDKNKADPEAQPSQRDSLDELQYKPVVR